MLFQLPFTLVCVFTIKYFSKREKGRERETYTWITGFFVLVWCFVLRLKAPHKRPRAYCDN